ncbi:MAG: hypothetical protein AAFN94_13425 [Pseudomonadota bacterium]
MYQTPEYDRAAAAHAYAASYRAAKAAGAYPHAGYAAYSVGNATRSAANAAETAAYAVDAATAAAEGAAYAASDPTGGWGWVRRDLAFCAASPGGDLPALWDGLEEPAAFKTAWVEARAALLADQMQGDGNLSWRVFVLMIDRIRAGRDIHAQVLADCLEGLTQEEIERVPALVLPRFDPLLEIYLREDRQRAIAATPMGEDIAVADTTAVLVLLPRDRVSSTYLDDIRAHIQSAIALFQDGAAHNFAGLLQREIGILERAIDEHAKRPVLLLQDCRRVLDRLDHKERNDVVPSAEEDPDIFDFRGILNRTQLDLIALSPEVKRYHEATKPLAGPDDLALIADAADIARDAGDAELAEILRETAEILREPDISDEERRAAFYAAASRLSRMYSVAESGESPVPVKGKTAQEIMDELRWFTSNPQVQDAIAVIVRIFVGYG